MKPEKRKNTMERIFKKHAFIKISILIILVGIIAFVLAYGLTDGWQAVGAWFGSKYAVLLYIFIGLYGLSIAGYLINERIKKL